MRRLYLQTYGMFYWTCLAADETIVTLGAFCGESAASSFGLAL